MGRTTYADKDGVIATAKKKVVVGNGKNVYGSYVHGLFDQGDTAAAVIQALAEKKGVEPGEFKPEDYHAFKEKQYDKLADTLRQYLDMEAVYGMLRDARLE